MKLKSATLVLIALAAAGCDLLGGRCTYEIRGYTGDGQVNDNGTEIATAHVTFSESRGSESDQSFYWYVSGNLKGHVVKASFKDAADPARVVLDLPVLGAERTGIAEGAVGSREGADLTGFYSILTKSRGVIELQTDLAAMPVVTIPIVQTAVQDWTRPYCS